MFRLGAFRSRVLVCGLAAAVLLLTLPLPAPAQTKPPQSSLKQGTLQGTVYSQGMKSKVSGAVVKIRNLNNQREYSSQPTDAKGGYKILMIEEGWYTLGVSTPTDDFNLNYGIYIKAGETAKLSVEMMPGGTLEGKGGGAGGDKGFFAKPGGVLLIVAMAGAIGFGVYEMTKKEAEVSPVR